MPATLANSTYNDLLLQEAAALLAENPSAPGQRYTDILNIFDALGQQQAGADDPLDTLTQEFQTAYDQGVAANEARYQQLLSGYADRASAFGSASLPIISGLNAMKSDQASADAALLGAYGALKGEAGDTRSRVLAGLQGLGDQAREDISRLYTGRRSQAEQDLVNRGLGNSTIRSSVLAGLTSAESAERRRLEEELRREALGYDVTLSQRMEDIGAAGLTAQEKAGTRQAALGTQALDYAGTVADTQNELAKDRLDTMERRTDTYPTLGDLANLALQYGRSKESRLPLPTFGAQNNTGFTFV